MKLYYAKTSDKICRHCKGSIHREEVYVVEQLGVYGEAGAKSFFIILHYDCYIPWKTRILQEKFSKFTLSHRKSSRMGRKPLPCLDRPRRRKLLSLRAYHAGVGNTNRVEEINREIASLEISGIIEGNPQPSDSPEAPPSSRVDQVAGGSNPV